MKGVQFHAESGMQFRPNVLKAINPVLKGFYMQESNSSRRPLSPHATIYRWPLNAIMSIMHRVTGVGMAVGAVLVVWWLVAAASSTDYFRFVDGFMTSLIGDLVMFGLVVALWFHFFNGIRHLIWDAGAGYGEASVTRSGWLGIGATAICSVGTVLLLWL